MEKWVVTAKKADFNEIAKEFNIDPVTARLIRNRDIVGNEEIKTYLAGTKESLYSPWLLKDMEKAVDILEKKVLEKAKIRVIGDYDIDGVMSSYILLKGFRTIQGNIDIKIPNRILDGYGVNIDLVQSAYEDGVDTILTCDNGIAASKQVEYAKQLGMTVVVTDHHEVPYQNGEDGEIEYLLPPADAIVNPKQEDCSYPFSGICGAVVAYKLVCALYERFHRTQEEMDELIEYAAFATIGDVMDLKDENRILVKEGLERLKHTQNIGLRELIKVNHLKEEELSAYHIGFVLGPCLNASGRLDTAARSLALLNAKDASEAAVLAGDLKQLNDSRKELTKRGVEAAFEQIENSTLNRDNVLVVYLEECHESLAGIIAGKIREKYHKPVFVLTDAIDGEVKGSGRSIEEYSMYEEMTKCKEFFTKYGGHPMAAGLSMEKKNISLFRKRINELSTLTEEQLIEKITIDVPMPISYIKESLIEEFQILEPFGKGNTKPVFAQKNLEVLDFKIFGKNKNVAKLTLQEQENYPIEAIYFGDVQSLQDRVRQSRTIMITYYPEINEYMGRRKIQIVITHYQ